MPCLGLLDESHREVSAPDYVRRDLSDVVFKMSPRTVSNHVTFVNLTAIKFPVAHSDWGPMKYLALYDDVDTPEPYIVVSIQLSGGILPIREGDHLQIAPGQFVFPITMRPNPEKDES